MKLTELLLNRFLYKESQTVETLDAETESASSLPEDVPSVPAGSAAIDINTGAIPVDSNKLFGPIPQTTLDISNLGWTNTCVFSSTDLNTVSWTSGTFLSASGVPYSISAGNTGNMSAKTYVYLDINISQTAYQISTNHNAALGVGRVLIAVCQNDTASATYALVETTQIVGDNILANSINASKMNVGQLSAITADIGSITAGTLTGTLIQTSATGQRVVIDGASNSLSFYNANNTRSVNMSNASGRALEVLFDDITSVGMIITTNVSGVGFYYSNTGNVINRGIYIEQTSTGTNNNLPCIELTHNGNYYATFIRSSGHSGSIIIDNDSDARAIYLINTGSNKSVDIQHSGVGVLMNLESNGSGADVTLYVSGKNNGVPVEDLYKSDSGNVLRLTNAANSSAICTGIEFNINNSGSGIEYAFDFQGSEYVSSGVSGTQDKKVRVRVGATTYYIPLYTA